MPAINFSMFIDKLENGTKTCTIRNNPPRGAKVGEKCKLYTGMRTKNCRLLGEVEIIAIQEITITRDGIGTCIKDYLPMSEKVFLKLVKDDGFETKEDFINYHFRDSIDLDTITKTIIDFDPLCKTTN